MPQHQQHFAKNTQIVETMGDLFPARSQYPLVYDGADRALCRIVAPMKDWHNFLRFLIEFPVEDRDYVIDSLTPVMVLNVIEN